MQGGLPSVLTNHSLLIPACRFDLAVTLDTYLVTYPTYGTLGFTWPALPV